MAIAVTTSTYPPSAALLLSSLPTDTVRVRVWRVWNDQQQRVRGDEQAAVIGSDAVLEDYDMPVGRAVSYWAQCFKADGSELAPLAATTPVMVALADPTTAWLSDPLAPGLSRLLPIFDGDEQRTYESDTTFAQIIGQNDPVAISGARTSASDWSFTFVGLDFDESAAIESLILPGGTLLVRADPTVVQHATGLIYFASPTVTRRPRHDIVRPTPNRADWTIAGRQVRPPSVSVVMPVREYADMEAENADYQSVIDDYTDYLALLRG